MRKLKPPPRTTEALGEEVADELAQWIAEVFDTMRDQWVTRDEYQEILSRMDILEHDMSGLKAEMVEFRRETSARFDAVNARFDAMEARFDARFDAMEARFDARFDAVNARIDTIHEVVRSQTRWLVGTLIALGGLISVLITVFEFIH